MLLLAVDLGTTNIKVAAYDQSFRLLGSASHSVEYRRQGTLVEFDAAQYAATVRRLVARLAAGQGAIGECVLTLTGQAESLVVLGGDGQPLCNAISWMDERSDEECAALAGRFSPEECYAVTGQRTIAPTWPATKILWLKKHRLDVHENAGHYLLLKDYIAYTLTGRMLGEMSVATFSLYFDIHHRRYWPQMLDAIGITEAQLPPPAEPCTDAGPLLAEAAREMGLPGDARINIGTLDHFAGMIGSGNLREGGLTLSTGTVMALAGLTGHIPPFEAGLALHYGFMPGSYAVLPVAESGGVCLEWFRNTCMPGMSFGEIDAELEKRPLHEGPMFLPYITGISAPEYDFDTCGVFWGLHLRHDAFDMAGAVMEGVAHLLRRNCDALRAAGIQTERIIATGGGAKSAVWCGLYADITGVPVQVPAGREAACLGAAMIGAVAAGVYGGLEEAAGNAVTLCGEYPPRQAAAYLQRHRRYRALYSAMLPGRLEQTV